MDFATRIIEINSIKIIHLPLSISQKLPSRGVVLVEGSINDIPFKTVLEPDGKGSHWLAIEEDLMKKLDLNTKDKVYIKLEPSKNWIEPQVSDDLKKALTLDKKALMLWNQITPLSRWDWIRWINSTNNPQTRQKRILVTCSKLTSGKRRVCCFDTNKCSVQSISKNGVLILSSN